MVRDCVAEDAGREVEENAYFRSHYKFIIKLITLLSWLTGDVTLFKAKA